jgi:hypothetical protein
MMLFISVAESFPFLTGNQHTELVQILLLFGETILICTKADAAAVKRELCLA